MQLHPAITNAVPYHKLSSRYSHVGTSKIIEIAADAGYFPARVQTRKTRNPDKIPFVRHMVTMRKWDDMYAQGRDNVNEIIITNSHDGSSKFMLLAGCFRFVCENGLIIGNAYANFFSKHVGIQEQDVLEGFRTIAGQFERIDEAKERMMGYHVSDIQASRLAGEALRARYPDEHTYPIHAIDLLTPRRPEDVGTDLWTTYNRIQENVMRGGTPGFATNGRRMHTRSIRDMQRTITLNKRLWDATESVLAEV